jgi:hypothetical protein
VLHADDQYEGIDWSFSWLDARFVLFRGPHLAVIDSRTLKLSYLPREIDDAERFKFSPDFAWVWVQEADGIHLGRVTVPPLP